MKKLILCISIVLLCLASKNIYGQNPSICGCEIRFVEISDCCFEFQARATGACDKKNVPAFNINITNSTGGFASVVSEDYSTFYTEDLVSFYSFEALEIGSDFEVLGKICFEGVIDEKIHYQVFAPSSVLGRPNIQISDGSIPNRCSSRLNGFQKICGSGVREAPNSIKALNDGIYVIGEKEINGMSYATLSKYDLNDGSTIFETQLNTPSEFTDFDTNQDNEYIVVVGKTLPFQVGSDPQDNHSLICLFDLDGNIIAQKRLQHTGREGFDKVIVHKNPIDPKRPIYALGNKNPSESNEISAIDRTILYNFDEGLVTNWSKEYTVENNIEIEAGRGILDLADGGLLFLGNRTSPNDGAIVKVDGDGNFIKGMFYTSHAIDFYDAFETESGGDIIGSGTDFGNDQAILIAIDPISLEMRSTFAPILPSLSNFKEIWRDAYGKYYTSARYKKPPFFNVVVQFDYSPITESFSILSLKRIVDEELEYEESHIFVSEERDRIFYTDARKGNNADFGNFDLFLGSYDLDLTGDCTSKFDSRIGRFLTMTEEFKCTSSSIVELLRTPLRQHFFTNQCTPFCSTPVSCKLTYNSACLGSTFEYTFTAEVIDGTPPYTYEWDINCDGIIDATTQTFTHIFEQGTHQVCYVVYDANGNRCNDNVEINATFDYNLDLICPQNIILGTDQGSCTAQYLLSSSVTGECPPNDDDLTYTYLLTQEDGTFITNFDGNNILHDFEIGVTNIRVVVSDNLGNLIDQCTFTVTVLDKEAPKIDCPSDTTIHVPACQSIADYISIPEPTVSDNCSNVSYTISHTAEDLKCGGNVITIIAEDDSGNATFCTYTITIICDCIALSDQSISCSTTDENTWEAQIVVENLTGAESSLDCRLSIVSVDENVSILSSDYNWSGTQAVIDLVLTTSNLEGCPIPSTIPIKIEMVCRCLHASNTNCTLTVPLMTPCCKQVKVDHSNICREHESTFIDLIGHEDLCSIQRTRWYITNAPCSDGFENRPIQNTSGYQPLELFPTYFDADSICVYAEIITGNEEGGCSVLTTDTVTIKLCQSIACSITPDKQEYCYTGNAITVLPLQLFADTSLCPATVQWYDPNGNAIPGATNWTYQPPTLSFTANNTSCYQDFTYTVKVTSECGVNSCSATIRLYNEDAPNGELYTEEEEIIPLCYGDAVILKYDPACVGESYNWTWHTSNDGENFTYLPNIGGNQSTNFYTNRLLEDTWYQVHKQNGVCSADTIEIFLPVNPPLNITSFTAEASPFCNPSGVALSVSYLPEPSEDCNVRIEWYKDGQIIHSENTTNTSENYEYFTNEIAGNYYVKIKSSCCDEEVRSETITINPPFEVAIAGPCFRCKGENVLLEGLIINPSSEAIYTYRWYDENGLIEGESNPTLEVNSEQSGPFIFEVACEINGEVCFKSTSFTLKQCGDLPIDGKDLGRREEMGQKVSEIEQLQLQVAPNPFSNSTNIRFYLPESTQAELTVHDVSGNVLTTISTDGQQAGWQETTLYSENLSAGVYYLVLRTEYEIQTQKIVILD